MSEVLNKFNRIVLSTHSGRDRLNKLAQYGSMILLWYYPRPNNNGLRLFKSLIGNTRRIGYLFGLFEIIPDIIIDLNNLSINSFQWWLNFIADISDSAYFICDNIPFLASFGFIPLKKSNQNWLYDEISIRFWFIAMSCRLLLKLRDLRKNNSTQNNLNTTEKTKRLYLSFIATLCMWLISTYYMFPNGPMNGPLAGICGVTNSLIGFYLSWE